MAASVDPEEPMDVSDQSASSAGPAELLVTSSAKEDVAKIAVKAKWSGPDQPQRAQIQLQKVLQSWYNKKKNGTECTVLKTLQDGSFLLQIKPAPAVSELQKLNRQQLTTKDGQIVTIISISLTPSDEGIQTPEDDSVNLPPSSLPQDEQMQAIEQNSVSGAVSTAGVETCNCDVPVSHFWYMCHIYKEEMERIAKVNGVKMLGEVKVTFEPSQHDGDPHKALSEFTTLAQSCLGESSGSDIPLKFVDPDTWRDAMKSLQKNDKVLLTLSSKQISVCGPSQSQEAISKSLNIMQKNTMESTWASQDTSLKIVMNIKDPLVDAGLTIDKSFWRKMINLEDIAKIKSKFGVDFKVSDSASSKEQVHIKVIYTKPGRNTSMESHAARAFLNLYRKIITSPMQFTQLQGASGFSGSPKNINNDFQPDGAVSEPVLSGESSKDETCPICMDTFTNKKRLKCRHEFCDECLQRSMECIGPTCPVCKDVFGVIEGDQPDGQMSSRSVSFSLPGFPHCGTIEITYYIPSGVQTKKHPQPGQYFASISRKAYLPDNKEGKEVLLLLRKAFEQKLIFTIGTSRTTGMENQVTWNDIHHKTSISGGPQQFGYPDPDYLSRVKEELKAKGIK